MNWSKKGETYASVSTPHVSVIIPIRNRNEMLATCLASIRRYFRGQIITVDDRSEKSVARVCATYGAKLIELPLTNPDEPIHKTLALNVGVAASNSEYLYLSDVDCLHPTSVIQELMAMYKRMGDHIYEPARLDTWKSAGEVLKAIMNKKTSMLPIAGTSGRTHAKMRDGTTEIHLNWTDCWGYGIFMTRAAFDAVGGFDTEMIGCGAEDVDFTYRLRKIGYKFVFTRETNVIHVNHKRTGYEWSARNWEIFHKKHGF